MTTEQRFRDLQREYRAFYEIRNQPKPGVEYEEWKAGLNRAERKAWAGRLKEQAEKVFPMIAALREEMKTDRPYHELRSYFNEDVSALEQELKQYGFRPNRPGMN